MTMEEENANVGHANSGNEPSGGSSVEMVQKLAQLARLRIPEDRKVEISREFGSILTYISQLDQLSLTTEESSRVSPSLPRLHNIFRKDEDAYAAGTWTESMVEAFPAKDGNSLSVKKIISND